MDAFLHVDNEKPPVHVVTLTTLFSEQVIDHSDHPVVAVVYR